MTSFSTSYCSTRTRTKTSFTDEDIEEFKSIISQEAKIEDYPLAESISKNVIIFSGDNLRAALKAGKRDLVLDELHRALSSGPGVYVITGLISDHSIIDRANVALEGIIEHEKEGNGAKGDHFAPGGANDRIWNSFQKHAERDPGSFVEYYANDLLSIASEAWLGVGYQITAQTNIVKPGGKAQEPHRDYHLGFQSEAVASTFPTSSQIASQLLTLQLAIAHSDMPIESGPTQLLPYSHQYPNGYLSYRHQSFSTLFKTQHIQLPLRKGDAMFFNPALFHAAGENFSTTIRRSANLMQVSACWSRPMEVVDRDAMLRKIWGEMKDLKKAGGDWESLVRAVADGYSFPTNLDRDPPPPDGHCPPSQLDLVIKGLEEDWSDEKLGEVLDDYNQKHKA